MIDQIDFNDESGYSAVSVIERVDVHKSLIKAGCNSLMPRPEAAMIVDRLHPFPQIFPLAVGQLIVLPLGFQDQVRLVVQPDNAIRGMI